MSDKSLPDRIPRDDWPRGLSLEDAAGPAASHWRMQLANDPCPAQV